MKVKFLDLVKPADEKVGPVAKFACNDFVFVAELMNRNGDELESDKEYEADATFFCHEICGVYKTLEDFQKDNQNIAEQSNIPMGAFSANSNDKNWKPSPLNYVNTVVLSVIDNSLICAPNDILLFYGKTVSGQTIEEVLFYDEEEERDDVKKGYIVSGVFWCEITFKN